MGCPRTRSPGIIERVLDDPDQDSPLISVPVMGRGIQLGQERAIAESPDRHKNDILLYACQQVGFALACPLDQAEAQEIAVPQQEHVFFEKTHQMPRHGRFAATMGLDQ